MQLTHWVASEKHLPHNETRIERRNGVKEFIERFLDYKAHYVRQKSSHWKYFSPNFSFGKMLEPYKSEITLSLSSYLGISLIRNSIYTFIFRSHDPIKSQ